MSVDSKEGRQNIFRIAKQKKKERKDITDITDTNCLKGDNGELLVSEEQVSDRWREYFEKLLNEENEWNDELSAEYVEGPADMISKEEVRPAIQDLKVRKAAGPSGVTGEMIKAAGEQAVDWLTSICNRIVKEEAIPESWQMSELVPIYKGGQRRYAGMQFILRHQATRAWNEGSRKSSREKVEAGSRDRQDAVWV